MRILSKNKFLVLIIVALTGCAFDNGNAFNATEICDFVDNDGDGEADEGLDCDGDNFCGNPTDEAIAEDVCEDAPDCNDRANGVNPGMMELCNNGIDDNCNTQIDEGCGTGTECTDTREGSECTVGTGACRRSGQWLCPANTATASCSVTAGQPSTETCGNGIDEDCDGSVDESCPVQCNDPKVGSQCSVGNGTCASNGTWTCNANGTVTCSATPGTPGTSDVCLNGLDDNCNGIVDENCPVVCNDSRVGQSCSAGVGTCQRSGVWSCNNGTVSCNAVPGTPGTSDVCLNGLDDNCNGIVDEGCTVNQTWYRDLDGDGFGCQFSVSATCLSMVAPTQPSGYVGNSSDCDDNAYSATNVCVPACLPPAGGTLRFEIPQSIANACPNRAIIVFDNAGNPRVSAQNATFWQEYVSVAWQGYVHTQLLCNVTNHSALASNVQNWWTYGTVFGSWPASGSDLSNLGFVFTLNGAALTNDKVINVTGGQQAEGWLPLCI